MVATETKNGAGVVDLRDRPYFGAALYGKDEGPILARSFFELAYVIDDYIADLKLNSLALSPLESRGDPRASATLERMKRGKSWRKTFEKLGDMTIDGITLSSVPAAKYRSKENRFLDFSASWPNLRPVSNLMFGGAWDESYPLFREDFRTVFVRLLQETERFSHSLCGFLQMYRRFNFQALLPHKKEGFGIGGCAELPLVTLVAEDRFDGSLSKMPSAEWRGEPFNLYWGNLVGRDFAEKFDLIRYLTDDVGIEEAKITATIPARACVGNVEEEFVFFCLSGDIRDSLHPDIQYEERYMKILNFLLKNDAIYPGL